MKQPKQPKAEKKRHPKPKPLESRREVGFAIPRTLKEAEKRGLIPTTTAPEAENILLMAITATVPVGHLWRLGAVHGDKVYACYRTAQNTCDWVEVSISDIPDWNPKG
jgi:hypothetical protein